VITFLHRLGGTLRLAAILSLGIGAAHAAEWTLSGRVVALKCLRHARGRRPERPSGFPAIVGTPARATCYAAG